MQPRMLETAPSKTKNEYQGSSVASTTFFRSDEIVLTSVIEAAAGGENAAINHLMMYLRKRYNAIAINRLRSLDPSSIEDCVQIALLKSLNAVKDGRPHMAFDPNLELEHRYGIWHRYMTSILNNVLNSHMHRIKGLASMSLEVLHEQAEAKEGHTDFAALTCRSSEQTYFSSALLEQFHEAVSGLQDIHASVIHARVVEELSVAKAAKLLKITEGTVKSRSARARALLMKALFPKAEEQ